MSAEKLRQEALALFAELQDLKDECAEFETLAKDCAGPNGRADPKNTIRLMKLNIKYKQDEALRKTEEWKEAKRKE